MVIPPPTTSKSTRLTLILSAPAEIASSSVWRPAWERERERAQPGCGLRQSESDGATNAIEARQRAAILGQSGQTCAAAGAAATASFKQVVAPPCPLVPLVLTCV